MVAMTHAGYLAAGWGDRRWSSSAPTPSAPSGAVDALAAQVPPEERRWS